MSSEQDPLLPRARHASASVFGRITSYIVSAWPTLQLLLLPHLLGLILSVATASEVDALRSLSCAHYYAAHPLGIEGGVDAESCLNPAVEVHFNSLAARITCSVVLANFAGMLLYGRVFGHTSRKWMALLGMFGCALARIPLLFLPLYQYPYLAPDSVRSVSPHGMLMIYWACAILGGFSGANELVTLTVESLVVDVQSPETRSKLFSQIQVAQLLGSSIGPVLGSSVAQLVPALANRCVGYKECLPNRKLHSPRGGAQNYLLFNTASYWLAVFFAVFGMVWILFVVQFKNDGVKPPRDCDACRVEDSQHTKTIAHSPPKYAWLGAFQRLIPVKLGPRSYDARILQFTLAEICTAMMNEGVVVQILVLGFVFHWGRDWIALGLSVSNTLRLLVIADGLPRVIAFLSHHLRRPAAIQDLSQEQVDAVLSMSKDDLRRKPNCCPSYARSTESQLLKGVSQGERTLVHLWRANVDVTVALFSFMTNTVSWLLMAYGANTGHEQVLLIGAVLLTAGSAAQPMVRSAACTVADHIVDKQNKAALPLRREPVAAQADGTSLPGGADSYLVIISTALLPCLLIGLFVRNWVYGATIDTYPGAFFLVIAGLNMAVVALLTFMRSSTEC